MNNQRLKSIFNAVHLQMNTKLCIFVKELHYKPCKFI